MKKIDYIVQCIIVIIFALASSFYIGYGLFQLFLFVAGLASFGPAFFLTICGIFFWILAEYALEDLYDNY